MTDWPAVDVPLGAWVGNGPGVVACVARGIVVGWLPGLLCFGAPGWSGWSTGQRALPRKRPLALIRWG